MVLYRSLRKDGMEDAVVTRSNLVISVPMLHNGFRAGGIVVGSNLDRTDDLRNHYTGFCLGMQGSGTVVGTLFNFFGKSHRKQKRTLDRKAKVSYNGFTIIMATICAQEGLVPFSSIHCRRHHYGIWIGNRSRYCCQY